MKIKTKSFSGTFIIDSISNSKFQNVTLTYQSPETIIETELFGEKYLYIPIDGDTYFESFSTILNEPTYNLPLKKKRILELFNALYKFKK